MQGKVPKSIEIIYTALGLVLEDSILGIGPVVVLDEPGQIDHCKVMFTVFWRHIFKKWIQEKRVGRNHCWECELTWVICVASGWLE